MVVLHLATICPIQGWTYSDNQAAWQSGQTDTPATPVARDTAFNASVVTLSTRVECVLGRNLTNGCDAAGKCKQGKKASGRLCVSLALTSRFIAQATAPHAFSTIETGQKGRATDASCYTMMICVAMAPH